ncbi:hypothetical protein EDC56_1194 [Sinobacterium caligoides]|uniref:Secreted protein n=1 Tax=Sinobacterium caligoides TaxID=933926 RepID=A0A3N2E0M5_9GAMM|nr:VPLPA-CTERM sorting domain-containing protein [Sinobacterium caligoides]ROS05648.1 hypothetical protein EDC56_1194 [Sinobacterium caligoides]
MKKLLLAAAIAAISSQASALTAGLTGEIISVDASRGDQSGFENGSFTGSMTIEDDMSGDVLALTDFSFTVDNDFTSTNTTNFFGLHVTDVTYAGGSTYSFADQTGVGLSVLGQDADGNAVLTYEWGSSVDDSNDGATYDGSVTCNDFDDSQNPCDLLGDPSMDGAKLTIVASIDLNNPDFMSTLDILSITLEGYEEGTGLANGLSTTTYSFMEVETVETPIPGAAWLFGSALVGLGGIARRRKAA